jgi:choice-of-anchor A domain-containing protein
MDRLFKILFSFVATAGMAQASSYLYAASPYNVFVRNNFSLSGSDTIGAVAAGGTITVGGGISLASGNPGGVRYSVLAATDFVATSGGSMQGNLYDGTAGGINPSFTVSGTTTNGNGNPLTSPIDFADQFTKLDALSAYLATLPTSGGGDGCVNYYQTIKCYANNPGVNVINIPAGNAQSGNGGVVNSYDLGNNYGVELHIAPGATLIINVPIVTGTLGSSGWTVTGGSQNVLFNYSNATSLTLGGPLGFDASLLAPYAAVTKNGGNFDGNLIASSFSGLTEFHNTLFAGTLPDVPAEATPEPAAFELLGGGLLALVGVKRRR